MSLDYGVSFVGFRSDLVIKPFLHDIPHIQKLILISSTNEKARNSIEQVKRFLASIGIEYEVKLVKDVFDFFEIYFLFEKLCSMHGDPKWINVSAGPGAGTSALAINATMHEIMLISYDAERDRLVVTDIRRLKRLKQFKNKYLQIIEELRHEEMTLTELSSRFEMSKSAMSRRLKNLRDLNVVKTEGVGRGASRMKYKLSEFGMLISSDSH